MFNKKHKIFQLESSLEYAQTQVKYLEEYADKQAAELKELKAKHDSELQHLQHALSQQGNEFRYILLEVARIGDVNLDQYTKFNQYEKQPRVNFKLLREDLQANDREIERVARLDSLGPTLPGKE